MPGLAFDTNNQHNIDTALSCSGARNHFTPQIQLMSLNVRLRHYQFLSDDRHIDWNEINDIILTQPHQVDAFTLGYAVQVGLQQHHSPSSQSPNRSNSPPMTASRTNTIPSHVVKNILLNSSSSSRRHRRGRRGRSSEARVVQQPWKVLGNALVNPLVTSPVFQLLLKEQCSFLLTDACPRKKHQEHSSSSPVSSSNQLLSTIWVHHRQWIEPKIVHLLEFLQSHSILWPHLSSTLYGAIVSSQSLSILSLILERVIQRQGAGAVLERGTDFIARRIVTCKQICGPWGEYSENCLQALARYARHDVMKWIIRNENGVSLFQKKDVVTYRLLDIVAQGGSQSTISFNGISSPLVDDSITSETTQTKRNIAGSSPRIELAKYYIHLNPTALSIQGDTGEAFLPICHACESGNLELIKLYLTEGVKSQVHGPHGRGGLFLSPIMTCHGDDVGYNLLQLLMDNSEASAADMDVSDFEELIQFLIGSSPCLLHTEDVVRYNLLHIVLQDKFENTRAAERIINFCPKSLSERNEYGNLPLHSAVTRYPNLPSVECHGLYEMYGDLKPRMLALIIEESIKRNHLQPCNLLDALAQEQNISGRSVIDLIFEFCKRTDYYYYSDKHGPDFHDKDVHCELLERFWQCLDICWSYSNEIPLLQSAIKLGVSTFRLRKIENMFKDSIQIRDRNGNLPLHEALENELQWDSSDCAGDLSTILYMNEEAASELGSHGLLPLHCALGKETYNWLGGIIQLVNANPAAVEARCISQNLYPFMIAAKYGRDLDSIYHLLRLSPGLALPT